MNKISSIVADKEDLTFARYELRSDGTIVLQLVDELLIDIEKAKMMETALSRLAGTASRKILVLNGKFSTANDEARTFLSTHSKSKQFQKVAVTIHSLSQRLVANFFIKINKPKFPIRFFTCAELAENWLMES